MLLKDLGEERERLLQPVPELPSPAMVALAVVLAEDNVTAQNRAMVRAMVSQVVYPYFLPRLNRPIRVAEAMKAAKVVMKNGNVYFSPIYRADFTGERVVLTATADTVLRTRGAQRRSNN